MMVSSGNTVILQTVKIRRPCLGQGRGGAWDHRRCGTCFVTAMALTFQQPNPSAGLSKATLAASRKPFQGNSRSYTPQTILQTLPQAFPRQLSQLQAPDNASNPSAGLSKATLAATGPSHLFLRAFKTAVCPPFKPQKKIRPGAKNLCKSRKGCPGPKKHASRKNASISCRPKAALDRWRSESIAADKRRPPRKIASLVPHRRHEGFLSSAQMEMNSSTQWKWNHNLDCYSCAHFNLGVDAGFS